MMPWSDFIKERCSKVMDTETETPENWGQVKKISNQQAMKKTIDTVYITQKKRRFFDSNHAYVRFCFLVEFRIPYLRLIYYCFFHKDQISNTKMRLSITDY